jgi:hypothetical protein
MTRRSSVRAHARQLYRDLAAAQAAAETSTAPTPGEEDLTARVRALYEDSAVPVAKIASIAGVSERTIYKYAAKQRWQKRYRRPDFAPVRGAGARFIRRDDKDQPVAQGLKATDPAGAARAAAGCQKAAHLSHEAQRQAQRAQHNEACIRAIEATNRALRELSEYRAECQEQQDKGLLSPHADRLERVLTLAVNVALSRWEALLKEGEQAQRGGAQ